MIAKKNKQKNDEGIRNRLLVPASVSPMTVPRKTTKLVDSFGFTLLAVHSTGIERGPVWVRMGSPVKMSSSTCCRATGGGEGLVSYRAVCSFLSAEALHLYPRLLR